MLGVFFFLFFYSVRCFYSVEFSTVLGVFLQCWAFFIVLGVFYSIGYLFFKVLGCFLIVSGVFIVLVLCFFCLFFFTVLGGVGFF